MTLRLPIAAIALGVTALLGACDKGGNTRFDNVVSGSPVATVNDINGKPVTFSAAAGSIENLASVPAPAGALPGYAYPNGFFSYRITGLTPGATVPVTVSLPAGSGATGYLKCGGGGCAQFRGAAVQGDTVTLMLTDGGDGDADGTADGVITDPGGPDFPIGLGQLSPNKLDFGKQPQAGPTTPAQTATLKNVGNAPLKIFGSKQSSGLFLFSDNLPNAVFSNPVVTLAPGEKFDLSITFNPLFSGMISQQLIIVTDAGEVSLDLTANVVPPVEVEPLASLDFGQQPVGSTTTRLVTLANVSTDATVKFDFARVRSDPSFKVVPGGTLQGAMPTLGPGQSGTVAVAFSPTQAGAASATFTAFFVVSKNGSTGGFDYSVDVSLSGTGVSSGSSSSGGSSSGTGSSGSSSSSGGSSGSSSSGSSGSSSSSSGSASSSGSSSGSSSSGASSSSSSSGGSSSSSSGGASSGSSSSGSSSSSSSSSGASSSSSSGSSSGSAGATGFLPFTVQPVGGSSSSGGSDPKGLYVISFPLQPGDNCPPGSTCTNAPRAQTVDANAGFIFSLLDIEIAAGKAGFLRPDVGNLYSGQGGAIFRASVSTSFPNSSPVQVSSENQATGPLCSEYVVHDFSSFISSLFFYQLPGPDGKCNTTDDIYRYTPLGAGANTAPLTAPFLFFSDPIEAFYNSSGKPLSFVAEPDKADNSGRSLVLYDATFQNPKTLVSSISGFFHQLAQNQDSKIYADQNTIYRLVFDGTMTSIHTLPSGSFGLSTDEVTDDGINLFFIEKDASGVYGVERQAMDGSSAAVRIGTLPGDSSIFRSLAGTTDNTVLIFGTTNNISNPSMLYSVPKNPASPPVAATLIDTIPAGTDFSLVVTQGANVYYNEQPGNGTDVKAFTAKDDGNSTVATDMAVWVYAVYDNQTPVGLYQDRAVTDLVQIHGFTDYLHTRDLGGTVTVLHLADGSTRNLTTLNYPAGTDMTLRFPDHGLPLGGGLIGFGTQSDLFGFDLGASDPKLGFAQLTNTSGVNERLIQDLNLRPSSRNQARRLINFE